MKLTRRKLAVVLVAPAAAAQTAPPAPAALLQAARDRIQSNAEAVGKLEIPMSAEPAFQFQA
jgi:hypothetical protein